MTVRERIAALREKMQDRKIDAYLVPTDDFHASCLLYTSPSPRDRQKSRMPSSA